MRQSATPKEKLSQRPERVDQTSASEASPANVSSLERLEAAAASLSHRRDSAPADTSTWNCGMAREEREREERG